MSEPTPSLRCSTCGTHPSPFLPARAGGTHYKIVTHGEGIPGHRGGRQARTCGTWVEDKEAVL